MTEEIKKKIDGYLQAQKCYVSGEGLENIRTDILYGYSLAEARIKELEEGLLRLHRGNLSDTEAVDNYIEQILNK